MFFRFVSSLLLVVLISMVGIGLEKQTLEMKRAVSRQYFQKDILLEMHAQFRLRIQQLTPHSDLNGGIASFTDGNPLLRPARSHVALPDSPENNSTDTSARLPLLRWEHPVRTSR